MKILVIQNRMGIGDMVIFLPFIEAISKKFSSPVSILVKENSKALEYLEKNKYIEKIIILQRDNNRSRHDGILGTFKLISDLKKYNFQKVFVFNSSLRFRLICKMAGIKKIFQYPLFQKKKQHLIDDYLGLNSNTSRVKIIYVVWKSFFKNIFLCLKIYIKHFSRKII